MKKTLFAATLALTIITGSSFANPPADVNRNVLSAFNRSYENAQEISWETKKDFVKATFTFNGKVRYAYYKLSGEEIATTRNLHVDELPVSLKTELRNKYGSTRWLNELFEVVSEQENAYYASINDGTMITVYKAEAGGSWKEYSRKKIAE